MCFLTGCEATPVTVVYTETPSQSRTDVTAETVSVAERRFQQVVTVTPSPEVTALPSCTPVDENIPQTRHIVVSDINYTAHSAVVQHDIRYVNRSGGNLTQIGLNFEPLRWQNTLHVLQVREDNTDLTYGFSGRQMRVDLPVPLQPGCEVNLRLDYVLNVPLVGGGVNPMKGFFGYTPRQMNLSHWLATVAVLDDGEWITRQPLLIGEQEVVNQADWLVTVNLVGESAGVTVAAPGEIMQISPVSWRYTHRDARDFSMSLSDQFNVNTVQTDAGVTVELYTFASPQGYAAQHTLDVAARSLSMYSDLFGALPYTRVLVVQGDFPDGMELSGLVFVGDDWFVRWPGGPSSYLTLITVHEVSHQWWYARVGNDPALAPWLDEALATYSEYIFMEEYYPDLKDWWWQFRVNHFSPGGYVDSTVYDFSSVRAYIDAVYLRGVRMLHEIRQAMGTEVFFQLLRDYATTYDGQIATSDAFWAVMTPAQLELTAEIRNRYLRQPQIVINREDG